jgi:hypothetical protein
MTESSSSWWDAQVAARSAEGTEEDWLAGGRTISAETVGALNTETLGSYARNHFAAFIRLVRHCTPEDQVSLLSTILLGVSQARVAALLGSTQTVVSQRLAIATVYLGYLVMCGGYPTPERVAEDARNAGLDDKLIEAIMSHMAVGSFSVAAEQVGWTRAQLRRSISEARKRLVDLRGVSPSGDTTHTGLGAFLYSLVDSRDTDGVGRSFAMRSRPREITLSDPDCMGEFRVDVLADGFDAWGGGRSSLHDADGE